MHLAPRLMRRTHGGLHTRDTLGWGGLAAGGGGLAHTRFTGGGCLTECLIFSRRANGNVTEELLVLTLLLCSLVPCSVQVPQQWGVWSDLV